MPPVKLKILYKKLHLPLGLSHSMSYRAHRSKNLQARASRGTATRVSRLSTSRHDDTDERRALGLGRETNVWTPWNLSDGATGPPRAHLSTSHKLQRRRAAADRPALPRQRVHMQHMPTWPGTGAFASFCCNSPHIVSAVITTGQRSRVARRSGGRQDRGRRASGGRDSAARAPERAAPC